MYLLSIPDADQGCQAGAWGAESLDNQYLFELFLSHMLLRIEQYILSCKWLATANLWGSSCRHLSGRPNININNQHLRRAAGLHLLQSILHHSHPAKSHTDNMFSPILRQFTGTLRTTIGTTASQILRITPGPLSLLLHRPTFPRHSILPRLSIAQQTRPAHGRPSSRGPRYSYQRFQSRSRSLHYLWKHSRKFRIIVFLSAAGLGAFYFNNIETVPVSGRRRFNVFSPAFEVQMAKAMYESTMKEFRNHILPANHPYTRMVRRVMERLVRVSGTCHLGWGE